MRMWIEGIKSTERKCRYNGNELNWIRKRLYLTLICCVIWKCQDAMVHFIFHLVSKTTSAELNTGAQLWSTPWVLEHMQRDTPTSCAQVPTGVWLSIRKSVVITCKNRFNYSAKNWQCFVRFLGSSLASNRCKIGAKYNKFRYGWRPRIMCFMVSKPGIQFYVCVRSVGVCACLYGLECLRLNIDHVM